MNISIAYDTRYGNGKIAAEYLAQVLQAKGHEAKTFFIKETGPDELPQSDIYIFHTPTHVGTVPYRMKGFLKHFKPKQSGVKYSLVITRMYPNSKTLATMDECLKPKGMTKTVDGLELVVKDAKGPLEDGFKQKIDDFAIKLIS